MNKYAKRSGAAALASFGALLSVGPTAAADTTLVLFEHDTVQHMVDLGGPGPGPGDQFIFAGDVFDRPGGVFLGTTGGSCATLTVPTFGMVVVLLPLRFHWVASAISPGDR